MTKFLDAPSILAVTEPVTNFSDHSIPAWSKRCLNCALVHPPVTLILNAYGAFVGLGVALVSGVNSIVALRVPVSSSVQPGPMSMGSGLATAVRVRPEKKLISAN